MRLCVIEIQTQVVIMYELQNDKGEKINLPFKTKDFRGNDIVVESFNPPHHGGSSGHIQCDRGYFYPGVANLKCVWVE